MASFGDGNLVIFSDTTDKVYLMSGFSATVADSIQLSTPVGFVYGVSVSNANLIAYNDSRVLRYSGFSSTAIDSFDAGIGASQGFSNDGTRMLYSETGTDRIRRSSGFSALINSSIAVPGVNPGGVAWDGTDIISVESQASGTIYIHSGFTTTISSQISISAPAGVTWDGTNLISYDGTKNRVVKYSGKSSTIIDSFAPPAAVSDVEWDTITGNIESLTQTGKDMVSVYSTGVSPTKVKQHSGFTTTIKDSYSYTVAAIYDVELIGEDLVVVNTTIDKVTRYGGLTGVITDSIVLSGKSLRGVAWDGTNLYVTDISGGTSSSKILKLSGFTSMVLDSFTHPAQRPRDLSWYQGDLLVVGIFNNNRVYRHSGFSSTVRSQITIGNEGVAQDGANIFVSTATKIFMTAYGSTVKHTSLSLDNSSLAFGSFTTTSTSTSTTTSTSTSTSTTTSTSTSTSTSTTTSTSTSTSTSTTVDAGGPPQPADYPALMDSPTAGPEPADRYRGDEIATDQPEGLSIL
ncbi:hypothetical protein GW916_07465 [bacterium]|nr:hypothetical protein [bacterium]